MHKLWLQAGTLDRWSWFNNDEDHFPCMLASSVSMIWLLCGSPLIRPTTHPFFFPFFFPNLLIGPIMCFSGLTTHLSELTL